MLLDWLRDDAGSKSNRKVLPRQMRRVRMTTLVVEDKCEKSWLGGSAYAEAEAG